jgi:membrane protease YdiL (CAAX protease family)
MAIAHISEKFAHPLRRLRAFLLAQASLVAIVLFVLALVMFHERNPVSSIGLKPLTLETFACGLVLAAFFIYGFSPLASWIIRRVGLRGFDQGFAQLQGLPVWALTLAVLIGGVAEEILYRGYAIERIAGLTGNLWLAATVPLVFHALAHLPVWGLAPTVALLVPAAIFTVSYLWQRDLGVNIVAHVATDFMGIVVAAITVDGRERTS